MLFFLFSHYNDQIQVFDSLESGEPIARVSTTEGKYNEFVIF